MPANEELVLCGPAPPASFVLTQAIINIVAGFQFFVLL
jgi:hypothetical protein